MELLSFFLFFLGGWGRGEMLGDGVSMAMIEVHAIGVCCHGNMRVKFEPLH